MNLPNALDVESQRGQCQDHYYAVYALNTYDIHVLKCSQINIQYTTFIL